MSITLSSTDLYNFKRVKIPYMKKIFLVCCVLLVAQLLSDETANAAAKIGSPCTVAGKITIVSGEQLICLKNGKKLLWVRMNSKSPKSLELSQYEAVKIKAYENIRKAANAGSSENIHLIFHISESFPPSLRELYTNQYEYAAKLYGTFFIKPEIVHIYMYTEKDSQKIKDDPNLNFNYSDFLPWFRDWESGIHREQNIGLASFYLERNGVWQGFAGSAVYSGSTANSLKPYSVQVQQHEFFHVVQDYYMQYGRGTKFNDQNSYDTLFPPTFREGSANTISFALASDNFSNYLSLYHNFLAEKKVQKEMPIFSSITSEKTVVEALNSIEFITNNSQAHEASYALGQLLYEYVIAQYGFDAYRRIIINQLTVNNFSQNIQKSIGITKDELYQQSASHILRAFSTN